MVDKSVLLRTMNSYSALWWLIDLLMSGLVSGPENSGSLYSLYSCHCQTIAQKFEKTACKPLGCIMCLVLIFDGGGIIFFFMNVSAIYMSMKEKSGFLLFFSSPELCSG